MVLYEYLYGGTQYIVAENPRQARKVMKDAEWDARPRLKRVREPIQLTPDDGETFSNFTPDEVLEMYRGPCLIPEG